MTIERRVLWAAGCIVLVGLALYWLRGILLPFAAGMAIAYFLDPVVDRLERMKMSRTWATSIVTAVFAIIVLLLIVLVAPVVYRQTLDLIDNLPRYAETISTALEPLIARIRQHMPADGLPDLSSASGEIGGVLGWVATALGGLIGGGVAFLNLMSLIFITPVVAFYLLRDWDALVAKVDTWLPRKHAETIRGQAREINRTLASFARGQATICLFLAAFYGIGLTAIGLEFGLVIGLLAGFLSFIPFVGSIVGLVGSLVLAYVQFDSWTWIAVTAGIFFVGQFIEGNILQPKLLGDSIGLHPVWVIFALLAGGALFGFLGLLLAVPVAAVVGVLSRFAVSRYMASRFYDPDGGSGGGDPPAPETA